MANNFTFKISQAVLLPLSLLDNNEGQIPGLPRNPRIIKDEKFKALKKSILECPGMLNLRELLVYPFQGRYVVIGGNMRLTAMRDLGFTEALCKIIEEDTSAEQLRAITMKDNNGYGEWDLTALNEDWDLSELDKWDMSDVVGFNLDESETEEGVEDLSNDDSEDVGESKENNGSDSDSGSTDTKSKEPKIEVFCVNEIDQDSLLSELTGRGFKCRKV